MEPELISGLALQTLTDGMFYREFVEQRAAAIGWQSSASQLQSDKDVRRRYRFTRTLVSACKAIVATAFAGSMLFVCDIAKAAGQGSALRDYAALEHSLTAGETVSGQLDLIRCTTDDGGKPGPPVLGGMRIGSYLIAKDRNIAFLDEHQTLDAQNRPVTE